MCSCPVFWGDVFTPRKMNVEPENTGPLEKEKSSSKASYSGSMLIFGGVNVKTLKGC